MSDLHTARETTRPPAADSGAPRAAGARKPTCAGVLRDRNDHLRRKCAGKANLLSCRCSGCEGDDRFPVILSPADAPLLNTAYDGNGGALTSGADSYWEVGQGDASGLASVTSWSPAQVVTNPPGSWAVSPFSNANWISNESNSGDELYYRIRFNLPSSQDPAAFAVDMTFYADNRVWEIYVNTVPQSTQPNGAGVLPQFPNLPPDEETVGFTEGNQVRIRLGNHWRPCANELVVRVKSPGEQAGLLAQNAVDVSGQGDGCGCGGPCRAVEMPRIQPCITVAWGDTKCDCMETNDFEVLCITVCNTYNNVTFGNLSIGHVQVTEMNGSPVPALPDGTPSVQVVPSGPICFGDIGPCVEGTRPTCVSRELVLYTRGAVGRRYKLSFGAVCFSVCHAYQHEQCFTFKLCQD